MGKRDIEVEATCLAWEQNGSTLAGDDKGAVALWMDDASILATDGVAKNGKLDRLGRPYGKGRGCGLFDLVVPVPVVPGSIMEQVPVAVKGCAGSGYGNRDLTQHHTIAVEHAEAGKAIWTFLVRQIGDTVTMRRIDAARVIREAKDCWHVRDDIRRYTKADGTKVERTYKRLRIEWARVNKLHPGLFLDADWVAFSATLPEWPY
tara:strand:+ start:558 stop:1172 length:615 start_codon:yes stop_codon:yes gene_type:complete